MLPGAQRFTLQLKLTSPFLGNRYSASGRYTLDTEEVGDVTQFILDTAQWRWALTQAMDCLGITTSTDIDYVRFPLKIQAPNIRLYDRKRRAQNVGNRDKFQCFPAGSRLMLEVVILGEPESKTGTGSLRPPTKQEITECFNTIGELIGLSPWGSKYGYGRFTVTSTNT